MRKNVNGLGFSVVEWLKVTYRKFYAVELLTRKVWTPDGLTGTPLSKLADPDKEEFKLLSLLWDDAYEALMNVERDVAGRIVRHNEDIGEFEAYEIVREIEKDVEKHFNYNRNLTEVY